MIEDKNILIGVSSGIAIYKVLDLVSRLKKQRANVSIIMTENACEFISPHLFEIMSKSKVHVNQFESYDEKGSVVHIELAKKADAFLLAPATANTIAKIAHGIADNLLTTTALAYNKALILAPTMNTNMLENPNTQANISKLLSMGHHFIDPNEGLLACNVVGNGRMAEPEEILDYLDYYLTEKDLVDKKIIITAGPTIEEIDPVRYITNRSSGKMGYMLAKAARNRGAKVKLIAGPNTQDDIEGVEICRVRTNEEMASEIKKDFASCQGLVMAAAPCDFKLKDKYDQKIKKKSSFELSLIENEDIIANFGQMKKDQILVGFAAETENLIENAKGKLKRKNLDYILANDVSKPGSGFDSDENMGYLISEDQIKEISLMSKFDMANIILDVFKDV